MDEKGLKIHKQKYYTVLFLFVLDFNKINFILHIMDEEGLKMHKQKYYSFISFCFGF